MKPEMILPLSSSEATLDRAGGKGASLAALAHAGYAVPPGFIVTTDAYRAFVELNHIGWQLRDLARAASPDKPETLERVSSEIRALFAGGRMPGELAAAMRAAYAGLSARGADETPVAVRSSATAEDLPGLSFAGQQDTYLNVMGPEAVLQAVKSCWGSLWSARAIGYRARNNIPSDGLALAVVVQVLIPSEVSGVLFTANPLTGHRGETVIDASFGLGEAIVAGQVEPDHYVVDQRAERILSRRLGAKGLTIRPRGEGGTEAVAQDRGREQALPDDLILDLARTARRVADLFGSPQDIEWAVANGRLYILQSRPITSLYPVPERLLRSEDLRVLLSLNSIQGVVDPLTPLGRDIFPLLLSGIFRLAGIRRDPRDVIIAAGGRLYADETIPLGDRRLRRLLLGALANVDPGARDVAQRLIESGRIRAREVLGPVHVLRVIRNFRHVILGLVRTWARPKAMRERAMSQADRYVAEVRQEIAAAHTLDSRLALIERHVSRIIEKLMLRTIAPAMIPGLLAMGIVDRWLAAWAGQKRGSIWRLLRGLPGNPTTEMDLRLWETARTIQSDDAARNAFLSLSADEIARAHRQGELPAAAQAAIRAFLDQYGMRAVAEIDIGRPRWREDPRSIIQNLKSFVQIGDPDLAPDRLFERAGAEAEGLAAQYVARVRRSRGRLRAFVLAAMIRRMRLLVGLREAPKFYIIKIFDSMRFALLDSGRELAAQGRLGCAEDIFFVPLDTLRAVARGEPADMAGIVRRERAEHDRELTRRQIPRILLSTGEVFYGGGGPSDVAGARELVGDGVSPGIAEGPVRVVHDPRGARLEPGEILVCPATDPGWTPLFLSAGGLVMEMGGMMTHGSVVAREYGIPAVVGVHQATRRLQTGQRVRVDGSGGRVLVLQEDGL